MRRVNNIIYFLDFPFSVGGSNKVLLTQAYIMKKRGFQVKVVILVDENGQHADEFDKICEEYELETLTAYYPISTCMEAIDIMTALRESRNITKLLKQHKPDLIHSTQLNIAVELAARELRIPHLMNIYPVEKQSFCINWVEVYPKYHSADSIYFSKCWSQGLGIPSRCIRVAYEEKKKKRIDEQKKGLPIKIISIGVFQEYKNQLEIIKFVLLCKQNNQKVKLSFLGDENTIYGEKCKKFVAKNDLKEDVIFNGFVSDVENYLDNADLFITASRMESYPGVIVESMANKIPIISTAIAGIPELVKDEQNGFLTKGCEAEDLYEAFLKYIKYRNADQISQLIQNAYITYLENHSYIAIGEQLEGYYQWIMEDYYKKNEIGLTADIIQQKLNEFILEKKIDKGNEPLMKKVWFMYHLAPILERKRNKKLTIWGAGYWGNIALEWVRILGQEVEFVGFIDSEKTGKYLGYPIVDEKDNVIESCGIILVALADESGKLEIMDYLELHGKVRNEDYFMIHNTANKI